MLNTLLNGFVMGLGMGLGIMLIVWLGELARRATNYVFNTRL